MNNFKRSLFGSLAENIHPNPKAKPEMYDLHRYNDDIIRNLKIFDPQGN